MSWCWDGECDDDDDGGSGGGGDDGDDDDDDDGDAEAVKYGSRICSAKISFHHATVNAQLDCDT